MSMKTIGLIGGMSWESSKLYYEFLNTEIKDVLGSSHSAKCYCFSRFCSHRAVDF